MADGWKLTPSKEYHLEVPETGNHFTFVPLRVLDKPPPEHAMYAWRVEITNVFSTTIVIGEVFYIDTPFSEYFHHTYDMDTKFGQLQDAAFDLHIGYRYWLDHDSTNIRSRLEANLRELAQEAEEDQRDPSDHRA